MSGATEAVQRTSEKTVDLASLCRELGERARAASRQLAIARGSAKNEWLTRWRGPSSTAG